MFSTDTRCNKEHKKEKDPRNILIPAESQENAQVVPNGGESGHQLRTLSPQKDTYPSRRLEIVRTSGAICTDEEGDRRDNHNSNASKICEIGIHDRVDT